MPRGSLLPTAIMLLIGSTTTLSCAIDLRLWPGNHSQRRHVTVSQPGKHQDGVSGTMSSSPQSKLLACKSCANLGESFVGIWNYTDNGDVPPKATIQGETTMLIALRGAALDLQHQEIFIIDKVQNAFFAFSWPTILQGLLKLSKRFVA